MMYHVVVVYGATTPVDRLIPEDHIKWRLVLQRTIAVTFGHATSPMLEGNLNLEIIDK